MDNNLKLFSDFELSPAPNCWAEIDLSALSHNVKALQTLGPEIMAVLKADAYGHGVDIVAPELVNLGVKHFGVATAAEGAHLREMIGVKPQIYVMTAAAPDDSATIAVNGLSAFVSTFDAITDLAKAGKSVGMRVGIHIEVDTGIGRAGIGIDDFTSLLYETLSLELDGKWIRIEGICTHFTHGENPDDANRQYKVFKECIDKLPQALRPLVKIHAANSPAVLNIPDAHFDIIRPGLLLYGIAPMPGEKPSLANGGELKPVLSLKGKVILVRDVPSNTPISYGRTFITNKPSRIATIGIGYGDGYPRRLSNIGSVILPSGQLAPIRGRVCMDQLCIELPDDSELSAGDTVTLIGSQNGTELRAADIAGLIDATPHEMTTCITQRVPRVVV